jgi:hypothetical protein
MKLPEVIRIIEHHNQWRQGADIKPIDPRTLTEAIEVAIHILKGFKQ